MIDEVTRSIRSQIYERVSSPLMGAFIINWSIWNYRFWLVIFSALDPREKTSFIDYNLYSNACDVWGRGIVFPVISTFAYIYGYPLLVKPVFIYLRNRQRELKEIRQQIDDETVLTKEEARAVWTSAQALLAERELEIEKLTRQLQNTKGNYELPNSEDADSTEKPDRPFPAAKLSDLELSVLQAVASAPDYAFTETQLINKFGGDRLQVRTALDWLLECKFVSEQYSQAAMDQSFAPLPLGRKYVSRALQP